MTRDYEWPTTRTHPLHKTLSYRQHGITQELSDAMFEVFPSTSEGRVKQTVAVDWDSAHTDDSVSPLS